MELKFIIKNRERTIREYFSMWVTKDFSRLEEIISANCIVQESSGPCYLSLTEMSQWIEKKIEQQDVLSWQIKEIWPSIDDTFFVVWNYTAVEKQAINFDGISLIHFDRIGCIDTVKNFQSKSEHSFPYHI